MIQIVNFVPYFGDYQEYLWVKQALDICLTKHDVSDMFKRTLTQDILAFFIIFNIK